MQFDRAGSPRVLNRLQGGVEMPTALKRRLRWGAATAVAALAAAGVFAAVASAAAPENTASPTIGGTATEGSSLTASTGTWTNSPASFAYQWQRCASDGTGCGDINGATDKTYTPTSGDVSHTLRVVVTATNSDGKASAASEPSEVIDSKNGPGNTVKPTVTGTAVVGEQLTVSNGSWSPAATSFSRHWPRQRDRARQQGACALRSATLRRHPDAVVRHLLQKLGPGGPLPEPRTARRHRPRDRPLRRAQPPGQQVARHPIGDGIGRAAS